MNTKPEDYAWISRLVHALPPPPGLVMFDIDCVLVEITPEEKLRPGTHELFAWMRSVEYEIGLWSGNREGRAKEVAQRYNLTEFLCHMSGKPPHPPQVEPALAILGRVPILTVDDDATERVPGWNFYHIEPFGPYEEPYKKPVA